MQLESPQFMVVWNCGSSYKRLRLQYTWVSATAPTVVTEDEGSKTLFRFECSLHPQECSIFRSIKLPKFSGLFMPRFKTICIVSASGPTILRSTYGLEPKHCNELLIETSCWAPTVYTVTLRLHVSRDSAVATCAECIFLFAFLRVHLLLVDSCMGPFSQ